MTSLGVPVFKGGLLGCVPCRLFSGTLHIGKGHIYPTQEGRQGYWLLGVHDDFFARKGCGHVCNGGLNLIYFQQYITDSSFYNLRKMKGKTLVYSPTLDDGLKFFENRYIVGVLRLFMLKLL